MLPKGETGESVAEVCRPPFGCMDIVIESKGNSTLIVIENKVGSGEGEEQCARYLEWMQAQRLSLERFSFI